MCVVVHKFFSFHFDCFLPLCAEYICQGQREV